MKKYIIQNAQERLEKARLDWAQNHFVGWYQGQIDTPEAKTQVEATKKNMAELQKTIDALEVYIKENK